MSGKALAAGLCSKNRRLATCRSLQPTDPIRKKSAYDVDDTVDRVHAPQSASRSAKDFDPRDVLQNQILLFPRNTGEERRVDAPAVDQNQAANPSQSLQTAKPIWTFSLAGRVWAFLPMGFEG
jgi:hypothetical protein